MAWNGIDILRQMEKIPLSYTWRPFIANIGGFPENHDFLSKDINMSGSKII